MACKKYLDFMMRILPESRGKRRPCLLDLEWNPKPYEVRPNINAIVAMAIKQQIRIVAEVQFINQNYRWESLLKRKFDDHEVTCLSWNPHDTKNLAVGLVSSIGNASIEIMKWNGERFVREQYEVRNNQKLSSVSWSTTGNYLLSVLDPDDSTKGMIAVINLSANNEEEKIKFIETSYQTPFSAIFKPDTELIFSIARDSTSFHVWAEKDEWSLVFARNIRVAGVKKIVFDPSGMQLAAIGSCEGVGLRVWNFKYEISGLTQDHTLNLRKAEIKLDKVAEGREMLKLIEHYENLLSIDFPKLGTIMTGSSKGSICVHEVAEAPAATKQDNIRYSMACFKWVNVQQYNPQGNITCVAYEPPNEDGLTSALPRVLSGGDDGIISLWMVTMNPLGSTRDELFDLKCYSPDWEEIRSNYSTQTIETIPTYVSDGTDDVGKKADGDGKGMQERLQDQSRSSLCEDIELFRSLYATQVEMMDTLGGEIFSLKEKADNAKQSAGNATGRVLDVHARTDALVLEVDKMVDKFGKMQVGMRSQGAVLEKLVKNLPILEN